MTNIKATTKRVKIAVYLDPEQKAALEGLTRTTRVPWAEYVREGIDIVLAKYRKQNKGRSR